MSKAKSLLAALSPGLKGTSTLVVRPEHTAAKVGSGVIPVLATPIMINVIEAAALACVEHLLPEGHQSLGTRLDVSHIAATPVGMSITAQATVTNVEGRNIHFAISCRDDKDLIGEGTHERVVVNVERFAERVRRKVEDAGS